MKLTNIILASLFVLLGSCSGSFDKEKSELAVTQFHDKFNESNFDAIYDSFTEGFKRNTTRKELKEYLNKVSKYLGAYRSKELDGWSIRQNTSEKIVSLSYKTQYEKGMAQEEFVIIEAYGRATIHNYIVRSEVFANR